MKTKIAIALSALLAAFTMSLQADIANYDTTIAGQDSADELYQFNFDDSLSATVGSGTFTAGANTAYTTDLSGNANGALSITANATSGGYTMANNAFVAGQGTVNSVGTLSFLFNISTTSSSEYFLSIGGDTTSDNNALALDISGGVSQYKIGNHSTTLPALTTGVWYYFAVTWNFNGTASDSSTFYIGQVGGSLNSPTGAAGGSYTAASEVGGTSAETGSSGNIVVGNRQANNTGMLGDYGTLATWSSQLTSSQIDAQYAALTTTSAPEPSSVAILASGGAMLLALLRRKKS